MARRQDGLLGHPQQGAARFLGLGANAGASSPEEFSARIRDELQQWRTLVKKLDLKFE